MKSLFSFFLVLLLTSCGTLFSGSTDKLSFSSDPSGAKVLINGQLMGKTPVELSLPNKHPLNVEFRLKGFENKIVIVNSHLKAGYLILDIFPGFFFGIIPLVVDAATGNWKGLETNHVHATLEKRTLAP
jgi:hypothetical protein